MPERRGLIVEGMNVIGSRPDGWWRDRPAAMRALVAELAALVEAGGEAVTVVFDGRPLDVGSEAVPRLEVLFASRSRRNAANDDIVAFVEAAARPAELRVSPRTRSSCAG